MHAWAIHVHHVVRYAFLPFDYTCNEPACVLAMQTAAPAQLPLPLVACACHDVCSGSPPAKPLTPFAAGPA
eukprot:362520-Chlamydomonas_euryale.AAC.4